MANFTSNNDEGKDVETTEEQPALTKKWWHSLQANIIEGFHIDLAKRPSIKDLVDSYIQAMEMDNNESDDGSGEMEIELRLDCLWGDGKTLIPGVSVTSSRIKAATRLSAFLSCAWPKSHAVKRSLMSKSISVVFQLP
jgi:hypothetical protein